MRRASSQVRGGAPVAAAVAVSPAAADAAIPATRLSRAHDLWHRWFRVTGRQARRRVRQPRRAPPPTLQAGARGRWAAVTRWQRCGGGGPVSGLVASRDRSLTSSRSLRELPNAGWTGVPNEVRQRVNGLRGVRARRLTTPQRHTLLHMHGSAHGIEVLPNLFNF